MVEEYGVKLDDIRYDQLNDFYAQFRNHFKADEIYLFLCWIYDAMEWNIKDAKKTVEYDKKIMELMSGKREQLNSQKQKEK